MFYRQMRKQLKDKTGLISIIYFPTSNHQVMLTLNRSN